MDLLVLSDRRLSAPVALLSMTACALAVPVLTVPALVVSSSAVVLTLLVEAPGAASLVTASGVCDEAPLLSGPPLRCVTIFLELVRHLATSGVGPWLRLTSIALSVYSKR